VPKLLVLCDLGHASPRILGLVDVISDLGWNVLVVAPKINRSQRQNFGLNQERAWKLFETPNFSSSYKKYVGAPILTFAIGRTSQKIAASVRRIMKELLQRCNFPNERILKLEESNRWIHHVTRRSGKVIKQFAPDLVLSSSSPFAAHIAASEISLELGIPWVADYRDLWSLNHTIEESDRNQWNLEYETEILSGANLVTTVSKKLGEQIRSIYDGPVKVIHNGFRGNVRQYTRDNSKRDIQLVYSGTIYTNYMNISILFSGIEEFLETCNNAELTMTFLGSCCMDVTDFFGGKMPKYIKLLGNVSYIESLRIQSTADLLILFNWMDQSMTGVIPTKFYEYLSTGNPILTLGGTGRDECNQILRECGSGHFVETSKELAKTLTEFAKGGATPRLNYAEISKYSYRALGNELESLCRGLL
jgi:hypothetical protein